MMLAIAPMLWLLQQLSPIPCHITTGRGEHTVCVAQAVSNKVVISSKDILFAARSCVERALLQNTIHWCNKKCLVSVGINRRSG